MPPHVLRELRRFFQDYKVLEGKASTIEDFYHVERALAVIRAAAAGYHRG